MSDESIILTHRVKYYRRHIERHFLKGELFSGHTEVCKLPVCKKSSSVQVMARRNVTCHPTKLIQLDSCKTYININLVIQHVIDNSHDILF